MCAFPVLSCLVLWARIRPQYELTPFDRLASNSVAGNTLLRKHNAVSGSKLPKGVPDWTSAEFAWTGVGEVA